MKSSTRRGWCAKDKRGLFLHLVHAEADRKGLLNCGLYDGPELRRVQNLCITGGCNMKAINLQLNSAYYKYALKLYCILEHFIRVRVEYVTAIYCTVLGKK